jgi:hypothetical protein
MINPNASDWSDLDLLTIEEAQERLRAEIAVVEGEIAEIRQLGDGSGDATIALSERRLAALRSRLAMKPPT